MPELLSGIVEIRGIAREVGSRCMLGVSSKDPSVDPVGSCVGPRGIRLKTVVRELDGEHIDIIPWTESACDLIRIALSPVGVVVQSIVLDEKRQRATVTIDGRGEDRAAIDAGRLRLVSRLVGWRLEVVYT